MKGTKKIWALLVMIAMLASFAACGGKDGQDAADATPNPTATKAPAPTEEGSGTEATKTPALPEEAAYTVTLPDGTEMTFEKVPERIVSMGPNITEMLYGVGAGDKLVGRTDYCDYPNEALSVESVGNFYSPDIEKIIELQPDVIIGSALFTEDVEERLKTLGIQVAVLYESTDMDGVYAMIRAVGQIAGHTEEAESLAASTQEKVEKIKAEVLQDAPKPSVYYVVGYGEYGDYTAGGDTFIGQMIAAAGGNNVAAKVSGWSYSLEALMEADPDIIILGIGEAEDFKAAENYKELGAVKNGLVFEIDRNLLDRQGYRNAEGMEALRQMFLEGMQVLKTPSER